MYLQKMLFSVFIMVYACGAVAAFANTPADTQAPRTCALKTEADRLLRHGLAREAACLYERCIEKNPENSAACFNLAIAYYQSSRWNEAQQALEKVVSLNPKDVEALYNLGCLYLYRTEEIEKAKYLFEKARTESTQNTRFIPQITSGIWLSEKCLTLDAASRKIILAALLKQIPF